MPHEKQTAPPSSHYCRSMDGLWVKAERGVIGVSVFWQSRSRVVGSDLVELDAQGEVMSSTPLAYARYADYWNLAGTISPSEHIIEIAGLQDFDWFQFGMMRHAAELIALGWGDEPEDVMSWFDDPREGHWIREGAYRVCGPERKPLTGLDGATLVFDDRMTASDEEWNKRVVTGRVSVGHADEFPFEFPLADVLASITISTVPI